MSDLKLSLCITNYNRTHMLRDSFMKVLDDPRIAEIIICDDGSNGETIKFLGRDLLLLTPTEYWGKLKFRLHPGNNVGMYENKKRAIEYASNEWCILFDSDNMINSSYIDALEKEWMEGHEGFETTIYCPDFAKPNFDYRKYSELDAGCVFYGPSNVKKYLYDSTFECLLNTCNYVVHKATYLEVWEPAPNIRAADSIYFMYLWLKAEYDFFVVPDMQYYHRVHGGSGFMQDVNGNMQKAKQVKELIKLI